MIGIDYTLFYTRVPLIINSVFWSCHEEFMRIRRKRGWSGWEIYTNSRGISLYFKRNRFGELNTLFIGFSPHSQINGGAHNANTCSIPQAVESIAKTLTRLGVHREDFKFFGISSIEIGVNFRVDIDPHVILESTLMYDKYFFQSHYRHKHYQYACSSNPRNKYKKGKVYVKSAQVDTFTGLTYCELGYCEENTMRIEFKIERAGKFGFMDFSNLESLFKLDAAELLIGFFWEQYENVFFFSPKDILKKKLSRTELKHFYQWEVPGFWRNCKGRKLRREKGIYSNTVKRCDLKNSIRSLILAVPEHGKSVDFPIVCHSEKMSVFLPVGLRTYRGIICQQDMLKDRFCNTCYYSVTG